VGDNVGMKNNTKHYLALIQEARRSTEALVRQMHQLPADLIASQLERAKANLAEGRALLASLPPHPLRGGSLPAEMGARADAAIATLEAYALTPEILERHPEVAGPAYSAIGQQCAQCDAPAWKVQGLPYCLDHDQDTHAKV